MHTEVVIKWNFFVFVRTQLILLIIIKGINEASNVNSAFTLQFQSMAQCHYTLW